MPSSSLPTGTVNHRRGNRTRPTDADAPRQSAPGGQCLAVHDGGSQSRSPHGPQHTRDDTDDAADRIAELEAEVDALERELARREADHQEIIHRYEHVLAESTPAPDPRRTDDNVLRARLTAFADRLERVFSVSRTTNSRRQADDRPLRERLVGLLPWR